MGEAGVSGFRVAGGQGTRRLRYGAVEGRGLMEAHRLPARMLRKEFTVDKKVRRATRVFLRAGTSELYLNGAKVGDARARPGLTDYDKHVLYVTYDVTQAGSAGEERDRHHARQRPLLRAPLAGAESARAISAIPRRDCNSTSSTKTAAGCPWSATKAGSSRRTDPIRANNEYDGEEYDARMESAGWSRAGFDDSKWEAAQWWALPPASWQRRWRSPCGLPRR